VSSGFDKGVANAESFVNGTGNSTFADSYQNSSQITKGAFIGGAAGALTAGMLTSGIGVLPGTATGAVLGASYGAYIDSNTSLQDQLENRGVNIIVLGDQVMIVIPSARLFDDMASKIKPQAYSTLNLVARYINGFTKMLIKISAYTNDTGSPSHDLSLSQQQADAIEKYLVAAGMDVRLLYALGCGGTHLVERNLTGWDDNDNYRIEITLEKLYV
jgi:outer membrane protein OmpA-like peptidoglycan-associated protein